MVLSRSLFVEQWLILDTKTLRNAWPGQPVLTISLAFPVKRPPNRSAHITPTRRVSLPPRKAGGLRAIHRWPLGYPCGPLARVASPVDPVGGLYRVIAVLGRCLGLPQDPAQCTECHLDRVMGA